MFKKARIKLSFFYVLIIAIGMIIFSVVFYSYSVRDIKHDISHDDTAVSAQVRSDIINHTINELESAIIVADLFILLILGFLCYLLAGRTLKPIREALDAQERFSANASHELRTPLAVMKTENEVFLQEKQPTQESARVLAQSNLEEIDRMTGMVQSLLMLARSKTVKNTIDRESVNLSELSMRTSARLEKINLPKKLPVIYSIEPDVIVSGDQKLIEQVFINVIQNAFTYTNKGGIKITISHDQKNATIIVSDSGIGIGQKDLSHVTEAFFKADQSRVHAPNSFGLGLSIVQEIVALHSGTFSIKSDQGRGTVVTMTFPLVQKT
jgi:two-component system, OmpR family, sensor histidine kinase CiaH